jgi:hypothetical protein
MSTSPPETRQAHPEEEPPVVRPKAYGLCTGPVMLEKDEGQHELFSVLALPSNWYGIIQHLSPHLSPHPKPHLKPGSGIHVVYSQSHQP